MNEQREQRPVTALRGVGDALAARLAVLGVESVQDLLFVLPARYEDRTRVQPIGSLLAAHQRLAEKPEPRHGLSVHHDRLGEHRRRPDPQAAVPVFLPIDDEFLECLAVPGDAEDRVFVALVVPVAARRDLGHVSSPAAGYVRFIHVIESCSTVAIETQMKYGTWAAATQR